jgi:hypothetical protein
LLASARKAIAFVKNETGVANVASRRRSTIFRAGWCVGQTDMLCVEPLLVEIGIVATFPAPKSRS